MNYYKDATGIVYAYERDALKPGLEAISEQEAIELAAPSPPTPEELAARRGAEIKARLTELDLASIRPLRAIADGVATADDRARLAEYEAEAAGLREELRG